MGEIERKMEIIKIETDTYNLGPATKAPFFNTPVRG
jgi:hypothetical protein